MWTSTGRRPIHGTRPTSSITTPAMAIRRPKAMRILAIGAGSMSPALIEGGLRWMRPGSARRCSSVALHEPGLEVTGSSAYIALAGAASSEQALLAGGGGGGLLAEVAVGFAGHAPAVRGSHDEADLQEIGLDQLRQGLGLVVDGGGDRFEADRAAAVVVDDRGEEAPVEPVEAAGVDALAVERAAGDVLVDEAIRLHLRVVAHAP